MIHPWSGDAFGGCVSENWGTHKGEEFGQGVESVHADYDKPLAD